MSTSDGTSENEALAGLVGSSLAMKELRKLIARVAPTALPVLIRGESGTGKTWIAHAIHKLSGRKKGALVNLSLAALPRELATTQIFGYARGAFTGANSDNLALAEFGRRRR